MTVHDFIRNAVGKKVYLTPDGDLGMSGDLKEFIRRKPEDETPTLQIIKLTKGGKALLVDEYGNFYVVPPRNVMEAPLKTV